MSEESPGSASDVPARNELDEVPLRRRNLLAGLLLVGSAGCSGSPGGEPTTTGTGTNWSRTTTSETGSAVFSVSSKVVSAQQGEVMEIPISLENTTNPRMVLGSEALRYQVRMDLHDGNGNGGVVVLWDTSLAGEGDASTAFTAKATDDDVSNVIRTTPEIEGLIAATAYPMSLRVGGTETDVATANVKSPITTRSETETQTETETSTTTEEPGDTCSPGHTDGDPACQQVADDRKVLTRFEGDGTALPVEILYPCGWNTGVRDVDDRTQLNATRHGIGDENAYVDIQVRAYHNAIEEGIIQDIKSDGDYDEVEYEYDGETRTGLVSSADTAYYGTLAHAAIPFQDALVHIELVSTLKDAACDIEPRPDYHLVKDMLTSIQPNPETTFADESDSF